MNNLSNTAKLNVGMKLRVRAQANTATNTANTQPRTNNQTQQRQNTSNANAFYTVQRGDTLHSVARKHSLDVPTLAKMNNLNNTAKLNVGMRLRVRAQNNANATANAARNQAPPPNFIWPARNILTFRNDGTSGVNSIGLIIFSKPGTEIVSSAHGTVKKIGTMRGYGQYIVISHENRYATVYSNLSSIRVREGDQVTIGKVIATSDNRTGKMHFQIDYAGRPEDPLRFLPRKNVNAALTPTKS
jgi:murein DD-endopeptidase MepM/ murein hydrolase activator NlpD